MHVTELSETPTIKLSTLYGLSALIGLAVGYFLSHILMIQKIFDWPYASIGQLVSIFGVGCLFSFALQFRWRHYLLKTNVISFLGFILVGSFIPILLWPDQILSWYIFSFFRGFILILLYQVIRYNLYLFTKDRPKQATRIIGGNTICQLLGLIVGQSFAQINLDVGTHEFIIFGLYAAIVVFLLFLPLAIPTHGDSKRKGMKIDKATLLQIAPFALIGMACGFFNETLYYMLPEFGLSKGISPVLAHNFLTLFLVAVIAFKYPLCWLADQHGYITVRLGSTLIGVTALIGLFAVPSGAAVQMTLMIFLVCGLLGCQTTLFYAQVGDESRRNQKSPYNMLLLANVMLWSGASLTSLVAGSIMHHFTPGAIILIALICCVPLFVFRELSAAKQTKPVLMKSNT